MSDEKINLRLDFDDLTIGDLEDFEEGVGATLDESLKRYPVVDDEGNKVFDAKGRPETEVRLSAKALRHLVWIVKRKEDPAFTAEDARNLKVASLEVVDAGAADDSGNVEGDASASD